ncbi:hypothetical protein GCM10023176_61630 [Micromonospora coerulea]|uniref:Nucleoid-associated protein n=1 Tax=Micromonospora coerulea TaxID=47856 RepID=A0ABP8T6F0_9ACTN
MTATFGSLDISRVIVHLVPKAGRGDDGASPIQLSDVACTLQDGVREELQARLRGLLAASGRQIVEDPEADSKVPAVVRNFLESPGDSFVSASRDLAVILREAQSGANSGGMLLVAECSLENFPAILVVKFEQERGIRAALTAEDGQNTFDMQFLRDLFLTNRSKVYKVGLFAASGILDGVLHGWAADKQMTGGKVAVFFLKRYLGCEHLEEPKELTRRFYERSQEWINKAVENPTTKARYAIAVVAELQSQRDTISVGSFATVHLEVGDRDSYVKYLQDHGVPRATFDKSVTLVESHLEKLQVAFGNGAVVAFPVAALEDQSVVIEAMADSQTRLSITGEMREVKGKGTPGRRPASDADDQ